MLSSRKKSLALGYPVSLLRPCLWSRKSSEKCSGKVGGPVKLRHRRAGSGTRERVVAGSGVESGFRQRGVPQVLGGGRMRVLVFKTLKNKWLWFLLENGKPVNRNWDSVGRAIAIMPKVGEAGRGKEI